MDRLNEKLRALSLAGAFEKGPPPALGGPPALGARAPKLRKKGSSALTYRPYGRALTVCYNAAINDPN